MYVVPSHIHAITDRIPDIDAPPADSALASARAQIELDIKNSGIDASQIHPSLIPAVSWNPTFSPLIEAEHARLQSDPASKINAIDTSRYTDLEAPPNTTPTSDEDRPQLLEQWRSALSRAYVNNEYMRGRLTHLGLLEEFGKNQWLIGNSQLEDILKSLEAELAELRRQQDEVEQQRRVNQERVAGELTTLEETWKTGVGRVLEVEVAVERLKLEILERRRAGAV
jgi:pre-mRNA-splicing factor SPF27